MRRFYLQIYFALLGIFLLFVLFVLTAWFFLPGDLDDQNRLDGLGTLVGTLLPGADRPHDELQASLDRLGNLLSAQVSLRAADGNLLAAAGSPLPAPTRVRVKSGWVYSRGAGPTIALAMPDGRWLLVRWHHSHRPLALLLSLLFLALAVGIGARPVARRITRRLEQLQQQVEALGAGELSARVKVEGTDEIADLARSFNLAAERIETLVQAQRRLLAYASHELRSPLTRIQMGIALLGEDNRPELRTSLAKDIAELDELIGELLLASRLDALEQLETTEQVDLLALLAEEGARIGAEVSGKAVTISGDPRLLRRLIRNLLENARRYSSQSPVEASVESPPSGGAVLRVADRGPGVPAPERERIFEPFYRPPSLREQSDRGAGLGLALVQEIARHHNGVARCLEREGGGTCFEVRFRESPESRAL
ncbi:MAG: HAMP domain-containing sensor histidine kinase [Terriglobia bacterium]